MSIPNKENKTAKIASRQTMEIEQRISPPDPSMIEESVNSDYNVPSHVEEDSIVEEVPSENSDSESDTDVWEVIEKGSQMGRPKLVRISGYSYVVSRVRNGTKYWRCLVRNSNMKCPATVTERCGVFTSSQAPHCHSPVAGASVLTKLKVAFKEKAQSDPLAGLPIIVDEAISKHMDGKSSINNYPGVKELRTAEIGSKDDTMVIEEQSISPPDPSLFDESVNSDYNVPSHVEEDSIVDGVPSENSASESDSDVWEVIEKGSQMGRPKLVNNSGYSYVVNRVRNGTKYWRCSVRNSNMKCPATVTERCGVFTSSQAFHCHSPVAGASVLTKLKVAFKEKAQSDPFTASPMIVDEAIYNHVDPTDVYYIKYQARTMKRQVDEEYLLQLSGCENLGSITSLDLSCHDLSTIDVDLFNKMTSLKTLDVSQNQLTNIPDQLKLPALQALNCAQNLLDSVTFVKNFKRLSELFFDDNENLSTEDEYIVKMLRPSLTLINDHEDTSHLDAAICLYSEQLNLQLKAIWEGKFAEVYGNGVPAEEIESVHQEFVETSRKSQIFGSQLSMLKLRDVMIEHLCKELIVKVNKGVYNSSQSSSVKTRHSMDTGKSPRYGTRVAKGVAAVKDYSSGTPMEVDENPRQRHTPKRGQGNTTPRKVQSHNTTVRLPKRSHDSDEEEKGTPLKMRKIEGKSTPGTPRFTVMKQKFEDQGGYQLPSVDDYDPERFLRCHSKGNNPDDEETKIWTCAFEPRIDRKGETTNIVATCGGKLVCLIDCQTGKVMKRYKDNSKSESFYTLAWTTLEADGMNLKEDINILAVAGHDGQIKLIHPRQLVMFGVIEAHRCYISSLMFHPKQKHILFSASRDHKIIKWNIGMPDFRKNNVDYSQLSVLSLPSTDAISMIISPDLDMLVAGCEESCYAWNLKKLSEGSKNISPHYQFVHPREEEEGDNSSETVDSLVLLSNNYIVSKCVGHSTLYLWDLKQHCVKKTGQKTVGVQLRPLAQLEYKDIDVDYLYISAYKDLVYVGDDKGNVYMYNLKKVIKQGKRSDQYLRPSRIIEYPETKVDSKFRSSMRGAEDKEVVINCVAVSSSREFLVYGTDNNLMAIWRNSTKL